MSVLKVDELQSRTSGNRITLPDVNNYPPYRNLIINGDMSIAQRGTSTSGITGNGYAIDRFRHQITSAGTWTISQSTDVPTGQGFAYSQKFDCTTADASLGASDRIRMMQRVEGSMLQSLKYGTSNAESITISFWVKSNKTGTYSWSARDSGNSKIISASYTIDSANTWEKKTLTFAGTDSPSISNNNTDFLELTWWLDRGSTYSGGTYRSTWTAIANSDEAPGQTVFLADSTDNEWYITGVQLEVGTSATPFEFLPYDVNLQRCQRYFEILSIKQASQENEIMNMISFNASQIYGTYQFRTEKRNDPSLVVDNGTNYFGYYRQGGLENFSSIGLDNSSLHQASLYGTGLSLTSGEGGFVRWTNNASTNDKVAFDSEL